MDEVANRVAPEPYGLVNWIVSNYKKRDIPTTGDDAPDLWTKLKEYGEQCRRAGAEAMQEVLQTAYIAMTLARALPGVEADYDFGPAIDTARKALALPLPSAAEAATTNETPTISPSDPRVTIAGIRQFGLASDGSDLRDLEYAFNRLSRAAEAASPAAGWRPLKEKVLEALVDPEGDMAGEIWVLERARKRIEAIFVSPSEEARAEPPVVATEIAV